jgi:hypothetical protein
MESVIAFFLFFGGFMDKKRAGKTIRKIIRNYSDTFHELA